MALALVLAAGCDTMDQDIDGNMLSINGEPFYLMTNGGIIDLPSRIVAPGKITVEITGSTKNGSLTDLGRGILQYSPSKNSTRDSFRFRVFSSENKVLGEDTIGIIIPTDTTKLPCKWIYAGNDTVRNVTAPITVDVTANDWACATAITVSVNVAPAHGTATVVNNKIQYVPAAGFTGRDQLLYKATVADPSVPAGYGVLVLYGTDPNCVPMPANDLFFKPKNDTSAIFLDVLANDDLCDATAEVLIALNPRYGNAWYDKNLRKIGYRNFVGINNDDSLNYAVCGGGECNNGRVVIRRN